VTRASYLAAVVVVAMAVYLFATVRSAATDDPASTLPVPPIAPPIVTAVVNTAADAEIRDLRAKLRAMRHRAYVARLRHRALVRTLLSRPSVREAISLACATYGSCETLWRRAGCESHYSASAKNASGASGLFQFLPSTFASTPYGRLSLWSPYANALAAGWMNAHGRGGEWSCR
jgi:hypothetical protein